MTKGSVVDGTAASIYPDLVAKSTVPPFGMRLPCRRIEIADDRVDTPERPQNYIDLTGSQSLFLWKALGGALAAVVDRRTAIVHLKSG